MSKHNAAKPLPYYRWYTRDYRASRHANALTYIDRGLLRELLDECWEEGFIPDDLKKLAEICRCPVGVMSRAWPRLQAFFHPLEGLDGQLLTNPRLELERTESDGIRVKRSAAGRAGGVAKSLTRQMLANASNSHIAIKAEKSSYEGAGAMVPSDDAPSLAHEKQCGWCGGFPRAHRADCVVGLKEACAAETLA